MRRGAFYLGLSFLVFLSAAFTSTAAAAATFYISPQGSDTNPGTREAPWKTFAYALKTGMRGSDTLILLEGVYTEALGQTYSNAPWASWSAPNGSDGAYTSIKAERDGGAVLEGGIYLGGSVDNGVYRGSSYIEIAGLKLKKAGIRVRNSHHVKLKRIGIKNGQAITSRYGSVIAVTDGSHHVLVEDTWVIGSMVYGVYFDRASESILRRVVVRFDGNTERETKAGFVFYDSRDILLQNCLSLDFNSGVYTGFWNRYRTVNVDCVGCLALNLPGYGFFVTETYPSAYNDIMETVIWNTRRAAILQVDGDTLTVVDGATIGRVERASEYWSGSAGISTYFIFQNSIFDDNLYLSQGVDKWQYNDFDQDWQAKGAYYRVREPNLKYLVETTDTGTGLGGLTRGATILMRYGTSGTLWGEPGYDTLTQNSLWPWPYEQRLTADAREPDGFSWPTTKWDGSPYTVVNVPDRGFADPDTTLSKYIWEYLGNPIPEWVYGPPKGTPQVKDQTVSLMEDSPIYFNLEASDPEWDTLRFTFQTQPLHGVLSGTAPFIQFSPSLNFNGSDQFTYTATDGIYTSALATVRLEIAPVNDPPKIVAPPIFTMGEGQVQQLVVTVTDPDQDVVRLTVMPQPSFLTLADKTLMFLPGYEDGGSYSLTLTASDAATSVSQALSLYVANVNRAPLAPPVSVTAQEDTPISITLPGSDPDGDSITYQFPSPPGHGTFSVSGNVVSYRPFLNYNGPDAFTYQVRDALISSSQAPVAITVAPVNDPPVLDPVPTIQLNEGETRMVPLIARDIDGDTLSFKALNAPAFVVLTGNLISLAPGFTHSGSYQVPVEATDGRLAAQQTLPIFVTNVNRPPLVPTMSGVTLKEGETKNIALQASDPDGDSLTYTVQAPAGMVRVEGSQMVISPAAGTKGTYPIGVTVSDGSVNVSTTFTLTVLEAPPAATYFLSPTGSDTNPGTRTAPWKTFAYALKTGMKSGETLVLLDGTYTEPLGRYYSSAPSTSWSPPSGTEGAYTRIKADRDGGAILEGAIYLGGALTSGVYQGTSYLELEGLKLRKGGIYIANSHHLKLKEIGVKNGVPISSSLGYPIGILYGSHHILLEDVWVIGAMHYGVYVDNSREVILRRVLVRFDGNTGRGSHAGIVFYKSTASLVQNAILADFNSGAAYGVLIPSTSSGIKVQGSLFLKLPSHGLFLNFDYPAGYNDVLNTVFWDLSNREAIQMREGDPLKTSLIDQVTVGRAYRATNRWSGSLNKFAKTTVQNSVFDDMVTYNMGGDVVRYNRYDPEWFKQGTYYQTGDPGYKYIVQTPDTGTGLGGAKRGATILYKSGVSGSLFGEPGYDTLTQDTIWPWPNEERIKADAAEADHFTWPTTKWDGSAYTVVQNPARGLAAPGTTLTKYIWEYLGFPIPDWIYGLPTPAPTVDPVLTPTQMDHQQISGTRAPNTSVWMDSGLGFEEVVPASQVTAWTMDVLLVEGDNAYSFKSKSAGKADSTAATVTIERDTTAPRIFLTSPQNGWTTKEGAMPVTGTLDDPGAVLTINQNSVPLSGGAFSYSWPIEEGANRLSLEAQDILGNASELVLNVTRDNLGPQAPMIDPPASPTRLDTQALHGTATADTVSLHVTCSTAEAHPDHPTLNPDLTWVCHIEGMAEGANVVQVTAFDVLDNASVPATAAIVKDGVPPPAPEARQLLLPDESTLDITPGTPVRTRFSTVTLKGVAFQDTTEVIITSTSASVGEVKHDPDPSQIIRDWSVALELAPGSNALTLQARDLTDNLSAVVTIEIILDNEAPEIVFTFPLDGALIGPAEIVP